MLYRNDCRPDFSVNTIFAQLEDYSDSVYSRGYLCPSGDIKLYNTAMSGPSVYFINSLK
jgi:hypothetical protein